MNSLFHLAFYWNQSFNWITCFVTIYSNINNSFNGNWNLPQLITSIAAKCIYLSFQFKCCKYNYWNSNRTNWQIIKWYKLLLNGIFTIVEILKNQLNSAICSFKMHELTRMKQILLKCSFSHYQYPWEKRWINLLAQSNTLSLFLHV